jgi:ankyrin repeat protein
MRACIVSMDLDGKTALSYALSEGGFAVSELLLTAGATEYFARIGEEDLILRALEHGHTKYSPLLGPEIVDYDDESCVHLPG